MGRCPGEGNGNPCQYSCLENSVDRPWSYRVGHDWMTFTSLLVFLPGKFHGQSCLAGYRPWVRRAGHNWVSEHMSYCSISPRAFLTLFPLAPWVPIPVTCRWCPAVRDLEGLPQKASVYHHLLGISCPLIGPINYRWPPDAKSQLIGKDTDAGKHWRQEEMGMADDEMVGWHHWLSGHVLEQTIGDGEEQGSLARGCKDLDTTEWPNNNYNLI